MTVKAVALVSGGLDSTLAVKIVQQQGIEVEGLNVRTQFECCSLDAQQVAHQLGIRLNFVTTGQDYLALVQQPRFGRGRGLNPCVDCRIYMFEAAKRLMTACGAEFVVTGEVLGQRPMSQKLRDFRTIEADTGLERCILRPLSAKLLPPTLAEEQGLVDRDRLQGIRGRSRTELIALARGFGLADHEIPTPSVGCALTEPAFGLQVQDVFDHQDAYDDWDFQLLRVGRQFRIGAQTKLALGRNKEDNERLGAMARVGTTLFESVNFLGPDALAVGLIDGETRNIIARLMMRYTKAAPPDARIRETVVSSGDGTEPATNGTREFPAPPAFSVDAAEAYAITRRPFAQA